MKVKISISIEDSLLRVVELHRKLPSGHVIKRSTYIERLLHGTIGPLGTKPYVYPKNRLVREPEDPDSYGWT